MTYEIYSLAFFEDPDYERCEWNKRETVTVSTKDEIVSYITKMCDEEHSSSWYEDCWFALTQYDNGDVRGTLNSETINLWIEARPV